MENKKIKILEHAFASSAGAYYNVNLTKNKVSGTMYQVIDDKEYSLNEQMGLSENASFSEVVAYWGKYLDPKEQETYYHFFSIENLLKRYASGEKHVSLKYWTKSAIFEPMLAHQHIIMYKDESSGDVLAITYVLDLTQEYKEKQYKKELEEKQKKLEEALEEAKKVNMYREIQAAVVTVDDILNKLAIFDKITTEDELNLALPDLLASLGRYSMSDRAYIFTWTKDNYLSLKMAHEWCDEGVLSTINSMQDVKLRQIPNWALKLNNGEAIVSSNWDEDKNKYPREYELFAGQNIQSLIVIPIFANQKLNGFIGFDNPAQNKVALSIRLLSSIGGHIGSLKENFYMIQELEKKQESLKKSYDEIKKENDILDALSIDYTSVYYCDLIEDTMTALKQVEDTNASLIDQVIPKEKDSYSYRIQYYFDRFVIKESAPDFVYKLSPQYLKEYLTNHERFAYRFRTFPNPAGKQYFEVQIVRLMKSSGFKIVMGYRYIDDILAEQEKQKIQLENALYEAKINSEVINSIGKLYWLIYRMDLVNGTYEEISAGEQMHRLTGKRGNIKAVFKDARKTIVCLEHQEMMKSFLDTTTLPDRLQNTESIAIEYRSTGGSWHLARFIVKKRDVFGKVISVLYVVRQIDKEKKQEIQYKQELLENNRVLSGLSLDYTIAFVLNLDNDHYSIVFSQKTNHAKAINSITDFSKYVENYANAYALPEFKEAMKKALNRNEIKKRFEDEDEFHFSFETIPNKAGLSCFQAHIVKEYDGDEHYAFLGFRSVDEIVKKERYYKEALQEANNALQQELEMISFALPGGVKISNDDETYSFKYVSKQFASMLGYLTPEELMEASGGSIAGLAHPDDLETGIAEALQQYTKADHYEITYRMKCKDGSFKYIEDRGHKFINAKGVVEHWNLILDKNELVEKTIALESEKRASQAKSEFLSRMSHDMRTPLNGIIGLIDISMKHPDNRELVDANRLKERIAADHLLSLVNDTLELSKLENDDTPLYEEKFYLPTLLHEIETIAQMKADEEGISISYKGYIDCLEYPYLIGNPLYIKQILLNVITNGIKYNQTNGSVFCSFVEREVSNNHVILDFTIKDTGIGMKPAFLKNIFKPFVQEDEGARSQYMGTGLGMAIVKNLLDRMDGTINIESKENYGTTVSISIPFKIARKNITNEIILENNKQKTKQMSVLLAEDNELNREIASFILKDEGIEVIEAFDGKQALSLYLEKTEGYFDVILMDVMMPNMDGYEATKAIRQSNRKDSKTIPIIALTAKVLDEDKKRAREVGMNLHLSKPFNGQELIDTIYSFCDFENE